MEKIINQVELLERGLKEKGYNHPFSIEGDPPARIQQAMLPYLLKVLHATDKKVCSFKAITPLDLKCENGDSAFCKFKIRYEQESGFHILNMKLLRLTGKNDLVGNMKLTIYDAASIPTAAHALNLISKLTIRPEKTKRHKQHLC